MTLPSPPDVAGISLTGDSVYIITSEENRALCKSINIEAATDGSAHPSYYFIATQLGMGKTVAGFCEACDFDINDGPMLASSDVQYHQSLMCDQEYKVEGEITSIQRKESRKLGIMDMVSYQLRLIHANGPQQGEATLTTTNVWILPRRDLA